MLRSAARNRTISSESLTVVEMLALYLADALVRQAGGHAHLSKAVPCVERFQHAVVKRPLGALDGRCTRAHARERGRLVLVAVGTGRLQQEIGEAAKRFVGWWPLFERGEHHAPER